YDRPLHEGGGWGEGMVAEPLEIFASDVILTIRATQIRHAPSRVKSAAPLAPLGREAVESSNVPQPASLCTCACLGGSEGRPVARRRTVRKGDRPTETHQHPVDHQTVAPQVCEAAIVPVAWLDVGLELQFGADGGERRQG